ncbi:interaptin-like isoform X2 [Aethina tumida]|uniref:interaptin-like isoform X2 n=1 Tax=Aethina tumida TaxID=116153 RepID=UPI0021482CDD|nr:interaptin-like isoform X2 [Aethina tumida]
MSNLIPPLLNNSPPPLNNEDLEENEDFGEFDSYFSTPFDSPKKEENEVFDRAKSDEDEDILRLCELDGEDFLKGDDDKTLKINDDLMKNEQDLLKSGEKTFKFVGDLLKNEENSLKFDQNSTKIEEETSKFVGAFNMIKDDSLVQKEENTLNFPCEGVLTQIENDCVYHEEVVVKNEQISDINDDDNTLKGTNDFVNNDEEIKSVSCDLNKENLITSEHDMLKYQENFMRFEDFKNKVKEEKQNSFTHLDDGVVIGSEELTEKLDGELGKNGDLYFKNEENTFKFVEESVKNEETPFKIDEFVENEEIAEKNGENCVKSEETFNFCEFNEETWTKGEEIDGDDDDDDDDDDFDDFGEFETAQSFQTSTETYQSLDRNNISKSCEVILKEIFPEIEESLNIFVKKLEENDEIFDRLKDVTETEAVKFQWSKSRSQNLLFRSLNIDTRNILYGPTWNPWIQRASTFSSSTLQPLEPLKPQQNQSAAKSEENANLNVTEVPTVQFDWNSSGLINPLDSTKEEQRPEQELDFGIRIPLRETHIENRTEKPDNTVLDLLENRSEKQESIVTEMFESRPQNVQASSFTEVNVDRTVSEKVENRLEMFDVNVAYPEMNVFQSESQVSETTNVFDPFPAMNNLRKSTPPETRTFDSFAVTSCSTSSPEKLHPSVETTFVGANVCKNDDDDFDDFQTAFGTILKPEKVSKETVINWPNPGLSDEEIRRFESFTFKSANNEQQVQKEATGEGEKAKGKQEEEEEEEEESEWSDFVHFNPISCAEKDSREDSGKIDSTEDDEWSDFVSVVPELTFTGK